MKKIITIICVAVLVTAYSQKLGRSYFHPVNESSSKIEWKGMAKDHFHVGSFGVKGSLRTDKKGTITAGDFIIPIASIEDYDLKDPVRKTLLDDLKSIRFFNLPVFPDAKFHILSCTPFTTKDTAAIDGSNYMLRGEFTMLGQTHSLAFPARISTTSTGIDAEAKFVLDRTRWGMNIFTDSTKPLYILPGVNIHLTIFTN